MLPIEAWCFTRDSGSDARFLDIFNGSAGGERVERAEGGCDGDKTEKLHPGEEKKNAALRNVL